MNASASAIILNKLAIVTRWRGDSNDRGEVTDAMFTDNTGAADIVTSQSKADPDIHSVVLDIDMEAELVPSSTPGHYHLYIDHAMTWDQYTRIIAAMTDAGIVQPGYYAASVARGFTAVRLPWIRKEPEINPQPDSGLAVAPPAHLKMSDNGEEAF